MNYFEIGRSILKGLFEKRPDWSHKGDFGKLLIIGGSKRYSGAPALCAFAALQTGVDITFVLAPKRAADIISSFSPNLIAEPLEGDYLSEKNLDTIIENMEYFDAIAFGMGIGRMPQTMDFVKKIVKEIKKPCVMDADGLHALKGKKLGKNFVLTPHAGEFYAMSGLKVDTNLEKRVEIVRSFADQMRCTIVLKGHIDIISDGERTAINKTGNPYMTKGGTGDVLTGICGALLARKIEPFRAACAAAYISGAAGDFAAKKFKQSMLATDVIEAIVKVIK
jgi:NAD(P)H-hydrate epimerase